LRYNGVTGYVCYLNAEDDVFIEKINTAPASTNSLVWASSGTTVANNNVKLKFKVVGNTLYCYVNDILKISVVDSTYTGGYPGLVSMNNPVSFDNVTISPVSRYTQTRSIAVNPNIKQTLVLKNITQTYEHYCYTPKNVGWSVDDNFTICNQYAPYNITSAPASAAFDMTGSLNYYLDCLNNAITGPGSGTGILQNTGNTNTLQNCTLNSFSRSALFKGRMHAENFHFR